MKDAKTAPQLLTLANAIWLGLYLSAMAAIVWGLDYARDRALDRFDSPEARAAWNDFRADMKKVADDPKSPIDRKMPESPEPPTLRLLRDYYGTCVLLALFLCTALFVAFMVMVRGAFGSQPFQPRAD